MKALIISEDEKVYSTLDTILKEAAYDTIIYKWLLKALDNIEEIQPDLIVVSSSEYPRHWKTLVQFVKSGIGGDNVSIYLYEPTPVSNEDEEKARILGVTGCFSDFEDFKKLLTPLVNNPTPVVPEPVEGPEPTPVVEEPVEEKPSIPNTGHFMFTHPISKKFISGKFFDYNGKSLSCSFYNSADLESVKEGMTIKCFSFFDSQKTRIAKVLIKSIMSLMAQNTFVIAEIQEIYDEN